MNRTAIGMQIVIYAPPLFDSGFRRRIIDGEILALHARSRLENIESVLIDNYHKAGNNLGLGQFLAKHGGSCNALLIHIWKADAYGKPLQKLAQELKELRQLYSHICFVAFGYLAASAATELISTDAVDAVIARDRTLVSPSCAHDEVLGRLADLVQRHLTDYTSLRLLSNDELPSYSTSIVSIGASRGCFAKCSFCAYNADVGSGWNGRSIESAADDVAFLFEKTGARNFAFLDNDFGGTRQICRERALLLKQEMKIRGLSKSITFAINIRSETLEARTIEDLFEAGARTFLIGIESFSPRTLRDIFTKRLDHEHLQRVVRLCDELGITVVASYILWHPWQSLLSLQEEIEKIEEFGRHRIPQFLHNSALRIIPGTRIEQMVREAGLLVEAPFYRSFQFTDQKLAHVFQELKSWFDGNAAPILRHASEDKVEDLRSIANVKIMEFEWLKDRLQAGLVS